MAFSPNGFAAFLAGAAAEIEHERKAGLEKCCKILEKEAKRVIGTYDYGWPPLKPETIARKAHGDTPLLETGEMRESIEHTVDGNDAYVGSDNQLAKWHEWGTRTISPRPFFGGAVNAKLDEVLEIFRDAVIRPFRR